MLNYLFTLIIIMINVVVFVLIRQGKIDADDVTMSYHQVFNRREYQRLITSGFAHEDPLHLFFNMVSLYNVGTFVEGTFGHWFFLVVYFVSMVLGKLLTLQIRHNNRNDYASSLGASGAISGLLGCYFLTVLHYFGFSGMTYLMRPLVSLIMISCLPGVDGTSHFSCMAVGMAITYIYFIL